MTGSQHIGLMKLCANVDKVAVGVPDVLAMHSGACVADISDRLVLGDAGTGKLTRHGNPYRMEAAIGNQVSEPVALEELLKVGAHVTGLARIGESVGAPAFFQVEEDGAKLGVNRQRQFPGALRNKSHGVVLKANRGHRHARLGNAASRVSADGKSDPVELGVLPGFAGGSSGNSIQGFRRVFGFDFGGRQSLNAKARGRVGIDVATQDSFVKDNGQHAKLGVGGVSGNIVAPKKVVKTDIAADFVQVFNPFRVEIRAEFFPRTAILCRGASFTEPCRYPSLNPVVVSVRGCGHGDHFLHRYIRSKSLDLAKNLSEPLDLRALCSANWPQFTPPDNRSRTTTNAGCDLGGVSFASSGVESRNARGNRCGGHPCGSKHPIARVATGLLALLLFRSVEGLTAVRALVGISDTATHCADGSNGVKGGL